MLSLITAFVTAWFTLRFLLPLFAPFLFGSLLALAAEPIVRRMNQYLRLPRSVSAGLGVSLTFFLIGAAVLLVCAFLVREIRLLSGFLPDLYLSARERLSGLQQWLLSLTRHTPGSIRPLLQENVHSLFSSGTALVNQSLGHLLSFAGNLISHIPNSALTLGTAVLSAFMISAKLPRLQQTALKRIPKERLERIRSFLFRLKEAVSGWLAAQVKLMAVTFVLLCGGFLLLRIRPALLWAAVTALVDAFPVLGTGTVLLPWCLLKLLQGDTARAIGLAGLYATVSLVRSALEPKLVGRHLGLDPLATLISVYAGFRLWGILGMLLAPLLTVTAVRILPQRKEIQF